MKQIDRIAVIYAFQMGYAKMDQKGNGLHLRTFSRAFIIDDGEERFVFVSVDSAMIGNDIRQEVSSLSYLLHFLYRIYVHHFYF